MYECENQGCGAQTTCPVRMNSCFYCSDECALADNPDGQFPDED
jgi:hypothetical protein